MARARRRGPVGDSQVESLTAAACTIPTDEPEADGTLTWDATTVVLVRAVCEGKVGTGWTYGPPAIVDLVEHLLAGHVVGQDPLAVPGIWSALVRAARNATRAGAVGYAVSAVDMALWDLKARLLDVPLADLFGRVHDQLTVYGSGGFTSYRDEQTVEQLLGWTRQGFDRVKIKIGESWGAAPQRDIARMRLARDTIGPDVELYVDANGGYSRKQAARVLREVDDARVTWFEEPVSSDDLAGLHEVRGLVEADVAAGEYGTDVTYFRRMCEAEAVDCLQVDATRCGGYTEWLRAAAVAQAYGLDVSAHCAPNLHAHVAAATPNLRHLEWFHDHVRVEELMFTGTLDASAGRIRPTSLAGNGLALDEDAAGRHLVHGTITDDP